MMSVTDSLNLPTPTIFPWCTATSAVKEGPPEPSATRPFLMSRSYAMTLPPLSPDASGPICHLGAYYCVHPVTHQHRCCCGQVHFTLGRRYSQWVTCRTAVVL